MTFTYATICSGIEAPSVAWQPLGWQPVFFSEIEKFPCRLLAQHYPNTPNYGDLNAYKDWPDHAIDLIIGGTPCQSFSIAGGRAGLADPRGNLMLTYLAVAKKYRPRWLIWENVPGVLSSHGGRDFAAFLGALAECGYHAAWRVLDARYVRVDGFARAVPQRRRRLFVVGYFGDWKPAAKVLFERASSQGDTPPQQKIQKDFAAGAGSGAVSHYCARRIKQGIYCQDTIGSTRTANGVSRDKLDLVISLEHSKSNGRGISSSGCAYTLSTAGGRGQAVAFNINASGPFSLGIGQEVSPTLRLNAGVRGIGIAKTGLYKVRCLTPVECERLMGFPDNYTALEGARDTERYKALGNSMAVNCIRWLGRRIEEWEKENA